MDNVKRRKLARDPKPDQSQSDALPEDSKALYVPTSSTRSSAQVAAPVVLEKRFTPAAPQYNSREPLDVDELSKACDRWMQQQHVKLNKKDANVAEVQRALCLWTFASSVLFASNPKAVADVVGAICGRIESVVLPNKLDHEGRNMVLSLLRKMIAFSRFSINTVVAKTDNDGAEENEGGDRLSALNHPLHRVVVLLLQAGLVWGCSDKEDSGSQSKLNISDENLADIALQCDVYQRAVRTCLSEISPSPVGISLFQCITTVFANRLHLTKSILSTEIPEFLRVVIIVKRVDALIQGGTTIPTAVTKGLRAGCTANVPEFLVLATNSSAAPVLVSLREKIGGGDNPIGAQHLITYLLSEKATIESLKELISHFESLSESDNLMFADATASGLAPTAPLATAHGQDYESEEGEAEGAGARNLPIVLNDGTDVFFEDMDGIAS